jgi:predicted secreted protein
MVLPFGITNQIDSPDYQKGTDPGAPVESRMKKKILITTLITTIIFSLIFALDKLDLFYIRKLINDKSGKKPLVNINLVRF